MEVSDAKKLRALQDENRRLKQMVADQALDIQALNAVVAIGIGGREDYRPREFRSKKPTPRRR